MIRGVRARRLPAGRRLEDIMPDVTLRDPFMGLRDELWGDWPIVPRRWLRRALRNTEVLDQQAPVDISKSNGDLKIRVSLPGFTSREISCEVKDDFVTVKAEHEETAEEKSEDYYCRERRSGSIARSFSLPETVDAEHAEAEYRNGVLEVRAPVKQAAGAKQITIKGD